MAKKKELEYDKELYESIRKDLYDQLEVNNVVGKHFENLIEDYMSFWIIKEMLHQDVIKRGVQCKYDNGGGQSGYKKNESVSEKVKVSVQMLKILSELGLRPPKLNQGFVPQQQSEKEPDFDEDYL